MKHSVNAMLICDCKMRILSVDGRFGVASHDSSVWTVSDERNYFKASYENGEKSSWLLGDSGYPLEPSLLTPYRVAGEGSQEARYNQIHSKTRNIVERAIGYLKARFRCLLSARELHYTPEKAVQILNVCCALHNICLFHNISMEGEPHHEDEIDAVVPGPQINSARALQIEARRNRDQIKNNL